jgi:hypothetical protein
MQLVKIFFIYGLVVFCVCVVTCNGMDDQGNDQLQEIEQNEQVLGFMDLWLSYQKGQNISAIIQSNPNWLICLQNELIDTQNLVADCLNEIASYQDQIAVAQEPQAVTLLQDKLTVSQGMLFSLQEHINTIENVQNAIATTQSNATLSQT